MVDGSELAALAAFSPEAAAAIIDANVSSRPGRSFPYSNHEENDSSYLIRTVFWDWDEEDDLVASDAAVCDDDFDRFRTMVTAC